MNSIMELASKKDLLFTVNVLSGKDLDKLAKLGCEIADKDGMHFDGYTVETHSPFSLEHAKATLLFS
ncbi:MAG TPA: hypothetical protein VMD02_06225 [Candidatus Omnitrophota bacterium]|nr:hypothetical protein [Candidatus Omnitrophota bacterium]